MILAVPVLPLRAAQPPVPLAAGVDSVRPRNNSAAEDEFDKLVRVLKKLPAARRETAYRTLVQAATQLGNDLFSTYLSSGYLNTSTGMKTPMGEVVRRLSAGDLAGFKREVEGAVPTAAALTARRPSGQPYIQAPVEEWNLERFKLLAAQQAAEQQPIPALSNGAIPAVNVLIRNLEAVRPRDDYNAEDRFNQLSAEIDRRLAEADKIVAFQTLLQAGKDLGPVIFNAYLSSGYMNTWTRKSASLQEVVEQLSGGDVEGFKHNALGLGPFEE